MSLLPLGITILQAFAQGLLSPALIRPRSIGGFVADLTIEEDHSDELVITEHPVEQGSSVADHSYKRPASVVIRTGFSNSSLVAAGNPNYVQQVYSAFLQLQASRQPFEILTGKRLYENMLIRRLTIRTDDKTENALDLRCECQELIIASTQTAALPSSSNMKNPQLNAPVNDQGTQSLQPAPNFNAN